MYQGKFTNNKPQNDIPAEMAEESQNISTEQAPSKQKKEKKKVT